jgi:hypothetical protein
MWFNKRSSDGEGVFNWSVLLLVAVIDPHTFNSDDAYPLDPRQRDFISGKGSLSFGLPKSLSPAPIASLRCRAEVDSGTRSWEEQTATGREHSISEAAGLAND